MYVNELTEGNEVYTAKDSDFVKVSGYWVYRGTELEIKIPSTIQGESITSYKNMLRGDSPYNATLVTKVVSDNPNITNTAYMFYNSAATTLDLSNFDTSNVTDMNRMFYNSKATTLDLSNFYTSSVTDMNSMFRNSKATTLDLSSFNTSKVTNMGYMFYNSAATTLDLSNFNTSNVTSMYSMFASSKATTLDLSNFNTSKVTTMNSMFQDSKATKGYARTQADADKFNASSNKPAGLNFVVKP